MILCFSCILTWIIWIEFVMTLNIHQVLGVTLEEQFNLCYIIYLIYFLFFFSLFPPPADNRIDLFVCSYTREIKIQMEKEDRCICRLCIHQ